MTREILTAGNVPVPHEVIVLSRNGGISRVVLMSRKLDEQSIGYHFYAIGMDPATGRRISLAPTTLVELARPVVTQI